MSQFVNPEDLATATVDAAKSLIPSKRTLLVLWGTIFVSILNLGYFTGGYFVLRHFQQQHNMDAVQKTAELVLNKTELYVQYPILSDPGVQEKYLRVSEILCLMTKQPRPLWSFWSAFDYSVSIVTTVGYGVLHPKTWLGKVATCMYAMAGLPLYIIMLGAAGKYVVSMFETIGFCVCKNIILELFIKYLNIAIVMGIFLGVYSYFGYSASAGDSSIVSNLSVIELEGFAFNWTSKYIPSSKTQWSILESFYYSMISLTTIGFGDYYLAEAHSPNQAFMLFSSVTFGFALFSYAFETYAKASERQIKYFKEKGEKLSAKAAKASAGMAVKSAKMSASVAAKAGKVGMDTLSSAGTGILSTTSLIRRPGQGDPEA